MDYLSQHIEALIFTAEQPIPLKEIKSCLQETFQIKFKNAELETVIQNLMKKYEDDDFSFEIIEIAEGYQFLTKGAYHNTVGTMLKQRTKKRLSRAALETLSIIAYKQPVVKSEMEKIRGVSCDYSIQKLLEKELIAIVGRSDAPGRPLLYGTSEKFMDYFGIKSIKDLPKIKDFRTADSEIGEAASADEVVAKAVAEGTPLTPNVPQDVPEDSPQADLPKEETVIIEEEATKIEEEETTKEKTAMEEEKIEEEEIAKGETSTEEE